MHVGGFNNWLAIFTVTNLVGLDNGVFTRNAVAVQDCLRD